MKTITKLTGLCILLFFASCDKDGVFESGLEEEVQMISFEVAVPVTQSIEEFRTSIAILPAESIEQSGKIYAYKDYIFINDQQKGIHIIDNSDPYVPKKIRYIKIPQNTDVAIKNDKLYANSGMDLVIFDISNIEEIKEIDRIESVFEDYFPQAPQGISYVDFDNFDANTQVVVGYIVETRQRPVPTYNESQPQSDAASGDTGTGGSLARFNIQDNFLYVVGSQELSVFDISSSSSPNLVNTEYAGWQIETIFNYQGYLYLGSSTGLYIYTLENPAMPQYVSFLQHIQGCDPVVVKDNFAYVTIRGGNTCGQIANQLDVVDITDKEAPYVIESYEMENPYGLGVKDNWLFVCDGTAGLKIFDTQNTPDLRLIDHFSNINTYDVIPLDEVLLMVGDNILHQYSYKNNEISLLSSFDLN